MTYLSRLDSLPKPDRDVVRRCTEEIRERVRRAAEDIVVIGRRLIEVKKRLGHGIFLSWLRDEFDWSHQTARRFMHVAERFGGVDNQQIVGFAPSALYALAAPSAPEAARKEALSLAAAGKQISHGKAKEIIARYAGIGAKDVIPNPASRLTFVLDGDALLIEPSDDDDYYYVTSVRAEPDGGAEVLGTIRPIRKDYIPEHVDLLKAWRLVAEGERLESECTPMLFNNWLYDTYEEYIRKRYMPGSYPG